MKRESPSPEGSNSKTLAKIQNESMFFDCLLALGMVRTAHNGALHSENIFPGPAKGAIWYSDCKAKRKGRKTDLFLTACRPAKKMSKPIEKQTF